MIFETEKKGGSVNQLSHLIRATGQKLSGWNTSASYRNFMGMAAGFRSEKK
jgi:hypothetical protein